MTRRSVEVTGAQAGTGWYRLVQADIRYALLLHTLFDNWTWLSLTSLLKSDYQHKCCQLTITLLRSVNTSSRNYNTSFVDVIHYKLVQYCLTSLVPGVVYCTMTALRPQQSSSTFKNDHFPKRHYTNIMLAQSHIRDSCSFCLAIALNWVLETWVLVTIINSYLSLEIR